jgi:putative copper resistance protein D
VVLRGGSGVGLINAWLRLGSVTAIGTSYGALVIAKSVAMVLLGVAGWRHRSSLLKRADAGAPRVLGRLAVGELVIMSVALGLGVALSVSAPPVSDSAPTLVTAAESITGYPAAGSDHDADLADHLAARPAVGHGGRRARRCLPRRRVAADRPGDRWPVLRTLPWLAGCLLLLWVTNGATGVYGRVLFSSHMLSHMTLSMVVPPLLVLGAPVTLALRTMTARRDGSRGPREWLLAIVHSRLLGVLGMPIVAAALFAVSLVVFYYSPLFELSLRTHTGHVLMHVHFLLTGYLFASVLIGIDPGPARPPYPLRLVVLFATMGFHAFFGMSLLQGTDLLAPGVLDSLGRTWGRTPLEDQRYGAGIAWGLGEFPTLMLGMAVALAWVRSDERDSRRTDRAADRDGDAELADYNARLADLARGRAAPR